MSVKMMAAVWDDPDIQDDGELVVALALADHANDLGECYPAIARLAEKCRRTPRTVKRILRRLEEAGKLSTEGGAGRGNTNLYTLKPGAKGDAHVTVSSPEKVTPASEKVTPASPPARPEKVTPVTQKVTPASRKGDARVTQTIKNHQEPSEERERGRAREGSIDEHWALAMLRSAQARAPDILSLDVVPQQVTDETAWRAALARAQDRHWAKPWSIAALMDEYRKAVKALNPEPTTNGNDRPRTKHQAAAESYEQRLRRQGFLR